MTGRAAYAYCVVHAKKKPRFAKKGLLGATPPRALSVGDDYHLVVSDAPLALYSAEAIDAKLRDIDWVGARAAEHEAVVEAAAKSGTVVPMKLFTLFASDERAIAHVQKLKRSLDKVVTRIAGCDEWGLRILFDETRRPKAAAARPTSGTSFLQRKKELEDQRRLVEVEANDEAEALFAVVAKLAERAVKRPPPSREVAGRVLLDAVFLVKRGSVKKLKTSVARAAKGLVPNGFAVSLTGPWPAYSFLGGR